MLSSSMRAGAMACRLLMVLQSLGVPAIILAELCFHTRKRCAGCEAASRAKRGEAEAKRSPEQRGPFPAVKAVAQNLLPGAAYPHVERNGASRDPPSGAVEGDMRVCRSGAGRDAP